jgi:peptidoglycan/xylan/chitin deacetylase (PgdA/CDA1 family)
VQPATPPSPVADGDPIVVSVAVLVIAAAFDWVTVSRHAVHGALGVLEVAALIVASALAAHRARGPRPMRVTGIIVALAAGWLVFQRRDFATALILSVFFGAGLGLATRGHDRPRERGWPRTTMSILLVGIVAFGMYVGAETPSAHWFGGGITHGRSLYGEVALTFDDGPNATATLGIMQILDQAHLKGTFFEVGKAIDADPQITRALYRDGQLLGNHSYHHDQWRWLDPRYPELERTQAAFHRAIGACPAFFRPPHGDRTPFLAHVVNSHGMRIVMWNDSASDWATNNPNTIARRIVSRARGGSIIVLHDGLDGIPTANREVLVKALPLILEGLHAKDLKVVGLDKLIGGPSYTSC